MNQTKDKKNKPLENDIKAATLNYLVERGQIKSLDGVISEFTLDGYSRRVDLVVMNKCCLSGFEIKSEADSLQRLDGQISKYLEYLDKVTIVAAPKHIPSILKTVSKKVGVWEFSEKEIKVIRPGKICRIKDKNKIMSLMRSGELLRLSNALGLVPSARNRKSAEETLKAASLMRIRQAAFECLKQRYYLSYTSFWQQVEENRILPNHIQFLSPYREERMLQRAIREEQESLWRYMASQIKEDVHLSEMQKKQTGRMFGSAPKKIERLLAA